MPSEIVKLQVHLMLDMTISPFYKQFRIYLCAAMAVLAACCLAVYLIPGQNTRLLITDTVPTALALLSAAAMFASAYRIGLSTSEGRAYGLIGIGVIFIFLGDLTWAIYELWLREPPSPSIADILYLLEYPFILAGLILLGSPGLKKTRWSDQHLEIGMILISSILIYWNFFISPTLAAHANGSNQDIFLALVYPVGDLLLLWALIYLLFVFKFQTNTISFVALGIGIFFMVIADTLYTITNNDGSYTSGDPIDLWYIAAYLFILLAGVFRWLLARSSVQLHANQVKPASLDFLLESIAMHSSSMFLVTAFGLLVLSYYQPMAMSFGLISLGVGLITLMALLRMMTVMKKNHRLVKDVESTLEELRLKSDALERTNRDLMNEINERKLTQSKLAFEELHDHLTGLPNREQMLDQLERAIHTTHLHPEIAYGLLFIDLDDFKIKNESLGHRLGDLLLIEFTQRLRSCLRSIDVVARMGGDEFAILLEKIDAEHAPDLVAGCILTSLTQPFQINEHRVTTTASVGVVTDLSGYHNPQDVLRDIDIAVYRAKAMGKNRYETFRPQMLTQAVMRMQVENEIRHAIKHNEFCLYYQPIFQIDPLQIVGVEALVRWQHPRRGFLQPGEFIPIAEETGLINDIGAWVLEEASQQLSAWRAREITGSQNLFVSVNISYRQFSQPDLTEQIIAAVQKASLPPEALHLEITESIFIDNPERIVGILSGLRGMGVQIAIDDFQTGYSSVSMLLNDLPVNCVKIDRSFVQQIGQSRKNTDIIAILVSQSHAMGLATIAEGIETDLQLRELRSLGCQYGQGFMLARPMTARLFESFIIEHNTQQA